MLDLPAVADLKPDPRTRRVHYDWLEAGEHTQRTVAQLSQQLRRFLDDQAWLENRRIMDILRGIEAKALAVRDAPPAGEVMRIAESAADIELPMERPLYTPAHQAGDRGDRPGGWRRRHGCRCAVRAGRRRQGAAAHATSARRCRSARRSRCASWPSRQPLQQGLAELVAYLQSGQRAFTHGGGRGHAGDHRLAGVPSGRDADGQARPAAARDLREMSDGRRTFPQPCAGGMRAPTCRRLRSPCSRA